MRALKIFEKLTCDYFMVEKSQGRHGGEKKNYTVFFKSIICKKKHVENNT